MTGFVNFKSCLENFSPRHNAAIKFSGNVHTSPCFVLQVKNANTVLRTGIKFNKQHDVFCAHMTYFPMPSYITQEMKKIELLEVIIEIRPS